MPVYNLLQNNSNYSDKTCIFGFIQKKKQMFLVMLLQTLMVLTLSRIRLN